MSDLRFTSENGKIIQVYKKGELVANLMRFEAENIYEGRIEWTMFLWDEWEAKEIITPEREAYLAECRVSR